MEKMKAVLVTEENASNLAGQFDRPEEELEDAIGVYVVTAFGNNHIEGYLSWDTIKDQYLVPGINLENGWFEIWPKD